MNENEFELDGKVYVKRCMNPMVLRSSCSGCAGEFDDDICIKLPDSCKDEDIIFVEKQP